MKKHFLLLATLLLLLVSHNSFGQTVYKLDSRLIEDWDEAYFFYNDRGLIDSTYLHLNDYDEYISYRLYTYNENGLCTREDDYQMLEGVYKHVSYIDYFYNEKNQLVKRLNYNSFGGDTFEVGGELVWTYNEDGNIATLQTSLPSWDVPGQWDLYSTEVYSYNEDKSLKLMEVMTVPFGGTKDDAYLSALTEYNYNDKKQLEKEVHKYYYEDSGDTPEATSKDTYEYDEAGNLVVYSSYLSMDGKNPQLRFIYHYDLDVQSKNVYYPFNLEENQLAMHLRAAAVSPNRISYDEWWQVPMESETEELEHISDYMWNYSEFQTTGIDNVNVDVSRAGYFIDGNTLYFVNLKEGSSIQIYDMNGAKVAQYSYDGNGISLAGLAKGGYICKIANQRVPFKFVR